MKYNVRVIYIKCLNASPMCNGETQQQYKGLVYVPQPCLTLQLLEHLCVSAVSHPLITFRTLILFYAYLWSKHSVSTRGWSMY